MKADGTPVTEADSAAEQAVFGGLQETFPSDAFLGEEIGARPGTSGRRWIVDGIDGTYFFAGGEPTWGTLIALETDGQIVLGLVSSPILERRWWATRGHGAFSASLSARSDATPLRVSTTEDLRADRVVTLPRSDALSTRDRDTITHLLGGVPLALPWCHQTRVASGEIDAAIWFGGDIWDHAAPLILVEEAGGRFSDHHGGRRLDTRTAIYSNGVIHESILAALTK